MQKKEPTLSNLTNPKFGQPPKAQNALLQQLGAPHVSSFDCMIDYGLEKAIANIDPLEFSINTDRISMKFEEASFSCPLVPMGTVGSKNPKIYPSECRQRAATYQGKFNVRVNWFLNDKPQPSFEKEMGYLPVMVKSNRCHLNGLSPESLVEHGEHEQEWGGYFIVKGNEKIVRMLLMTRRNYPIAIKRSGWKQKGSLFSEYGVSMRCVRDDQTIKDNVLHFVTDGSAKLMFGHKKIPYYVPLLLILKCLCDYTDAYIYQNLTQGFEENSYYTESIKNMLFNLVSEGLKTHEDCRNYLGNMFRVRFDHLPEWKTNDEICDHILKKCIMIHLDKFIDKFNMLVLMCQKLFIFAQDKCKVEGGDSVMMQELLLGGHLYLQIIKEQLELWLQRFKVTLLKRASTNTTFVVNQNEILQSAKRCGGIDNMVQHFFATGNLGSPSGLGLMQVSGLTIMAENINRMRYMSHFRSVHRGAFFQEMRTTEVRQLLPDAWGFICPVHTPDGAPCGLLNHLTMNCNVTDVPDPKKVENIPKVLAGLGMLDPKNFFSINYKDCYTTVLDGKIIGYVPSKWAKELIDRLREHKIRGVLVPSTLEIVLVPRKNCVSQYPGLYLFTGPARMMRPLLNLSMKQVEYVGTFEQIYLDVCITTSEFYPGVTTHMELSKTAFMSNLAHLIPMPDCNQSPRNMYQCQMGKQTMGTPCHTWKLQSETKLYRLQTPTSPLFRPVHHDNIDLDDFPMGTNAIVAVISYTGYDMEDAMIINKAAHDRGFAHGSIYKSEFIELDHSTSYFVRDPEKPHLQNYLDTDGLPFIGRRIAGDEPYYCYYNADEGHYVLKNFQGKEECYVDNVKLCSNFDSNSGRVACITFRVPRNPSVGDKFASRAGQKGICSQLWPTEDLPFTETGLVPDIVFNPHGFPSRMTIAMMIEIMAGKSAALHGLVHDATPFRFNEDDTAINYFGRCLEAGGYNYFGTETMYSGIDGREMTVQIFFGIVHYQRLRHMVSDKWQVRSTGPIDILTRQPLKGRKRGGGVRFGEMERDSLISHGASFLLQDRLFHCSDETTVFICIKCGNLLGPVTVVTRVADKPHQTRYQEVCRLCGESKNITQIQIPYIFKYFVTELASVNISVKLRLKNV